jgi:hypothetical protein
MIDWGDIQTANNITSKVPDTTQWMIFFFAASVFMPGPQQYR